MTLFRSESCLALPTKISASFIQSIPAEEIYFIFEMVEKDGKEELVEVEDEDLLDEISEQFEERLKDR